MVLPETDRMRPELLRKLRDLVAGGATITGRRPVRSPSLANYPTADAEVEALMTRYETIPVKERTRHLEYVGRFAAERARLIAKRLKADLIRAA